MNKFTWHKVIDTDDPAVLTKQVIRELQSDIRNAIRNGNYSIANHLTKEIEKIKQSSHSIKRSATSKEYKGSE